MKITKTKKQKNLLCQIINLIIDYSTIIVWYWDKGRQANGTE